MKVLPILTAFCCLVTRLTAQGIDYNPTVINADDNPFKGDMQFGGIPNVKPGLKVRLAQGLTYMIKENMLQYGLAYLNYDFQ